MRSHTFYLTDSDFIHTYENMRKAGRVDWSAKGKQTAAVNEVKFASRVFAWMETTGIYTLDDFNAVVSEHNADFTKLAEKQKLSADWIPHSSTSTP